MPLEPESDLHWTAFLYISGELDDDEASGFERLLAESQDARDAVAGAVELAGALAVVGEGQSRRWSPPGRRPIRRAFVGAALVAAAGLVLAALPAFRPTGPGRPDPSEVAAAWSVLRGDADADWMAFAPDSQGPDSVGPGLPATVEVEAGDVDEPSAERALPSWLLSAASIPREETPRVED